MSAIELTDSLELGLTRVEWLDAQYSNCPNGRGLEEFEMELLGEEFLGSQRWMSNWTVGSM